MSSDREEHHDPLLASLGRLPTHDVDTPRAEEIRSLAREAFTARRARGAWSHRLERVYTLALEPAFVLGVTAVYLAWALRTANAILTHSN
jgi:hypothetical protein